MRNGIIVCITLAVIVLAVYWQVGNSKFIIMDDPGYVTENLHVLSGISRSSFVWAFTSVEADNWHPLTWLSHQVDVELYGNDPRGHHYTNVIIHIATTLIIFLLLFRLTGLLWQSAIVAALFALHPLHVESVAWVAERKDTLCAFFWFVTLMLYYEYVKSRKPLLYIITLASFLLGLMSKSMSVTLPVIMLLVDIWPLDRYRLEMKTQGINPFLARLTSLVKEKIPFLVCSLLVGCITFYAQKKAIKSLDALPLWFRIENAIVSYVRYLFKTFWPTDLVFPYPYPSSILLWQVIGSFVLLTLITVLTILSIRRHPYLLVGWFWFLITLLPVIGIIQVGLQPMADRYTYIPLTGLFIMVVWGGSSVTKNLRRREGILALSSGMVLLISSALSWQQVGHWKDGVSLFRYALEHSTENFVAHNALATTYAKRNELDAAIKEFEESIKIKPRDPVAHINLGLVLLGKNDLNAAINEFETTLKYESETNIGGARQYLQIALDRRKMQELKSK